MWKLAVQYEDGTIKPCGHFPIVVTGSSEIGKSFFEIYALFRAVFEQSISVIYNTNNEEWFIIAPLKQKCNPLVKMTLNEFC